MICQAAAIAILHVQHAATSDFFPIASHRQLPLKFQHACTKAVTMRDSLLQGAHTIG